jgi:hypothetical protein
MIANRAEIFVRHFLFFPRKESIFMVKLFITFIFFHAASLQVKCEMAMNLSTRFITLCLIFHYYSIGPRELQMSRRLRILSTSHIMRQILEVR